jgi:integration host factor subunit beta
MTKSELIMKLIESASHISHKDMERVVNMVFDAMTDALKKGNRIELRGFGTFEVRQRNPREGRNPKSGAKVQLGVRRVPFFKAGKELKELINRPKGGGKDGS